MLKIGFDIGGVLSKYPEQFREMIDRLSNTQTYERECDRTYENIYIITDMHPKKDVVDVLVKNGFNDLCVGNIYSADYEKYGNLAKAVLIKELSLDVFVDDFDGYLQWDSKFGPQPILLKVMPDGFKPYWSETWKCDGGEFGRRKYSS